MYYFTVTLKIFIGKVIDPQLIMGIYDVFNRKFSLIVKATACLHCSGFDYLFFILFFF